LESILPKLNNRLIENCTKKIECGTVAMVIIFLGQIYPVPIGPYPVPQLCLSRDKQSKKIYLYEEIG
jgi:hypothetical protein